MCRQALDPDDLTKKQGTVNSLSDMRRHILFRLSLTNQKNDACEKIIKYSTTRSYKCWYYWKRKRDWVFRFILPTAFGKTTKSRTGFVQLCKLIFIPFDNMPRSIILACLFIFICRFILHLAYYTREELSSSEFSRILVRIGRKVFSWRP